ncbi:hypothetical protein PYW08_000240 [Mythimna loreyi]|uniref:Uncharacterized protein n=1 Tax=Mythimna loreyi TaxID=667449 RepID=A0ACC2RB01_9NEOP|nr:hypothetical protein PYW08_000240 [Mythimna loreyi]
MQKLNQTSTHVVNKSWKKSKESLEVEDESDCKCVKIIGHLDGKWLDRREYYYKPGELSLDDWTRNPFIWLRYVEKSDGILAEDDVLLSKESEYWEINEVQRYFTGDHHCEKVLFVYPYPYPRMPTPLSSHLWRANAALKLQCQLYQRELLNSMETTLKKMEADMAQMDRLIVPDSIVKLDRLDYFTRKGFFRHLQNILSFQDSLQLVSFENMCCKRLEGVSLLQYLACFNANTLKYLFLWRFVLPNENPLLINYSYISGKSLSSFIKR